MLQLKTLMSLLYFTTMFNLLVYLVFLVVFSDAVINNNVVRNITIKSQIVNADFDITFENTFNHKIDSYVFEIEPDIPDFYIEFVNENQEKLKSERNKQKIIVYLPKAVKPNESHKLYAKVYYINQVKPCYKRKYYKQPEIVNYEVNYFFYSPYFTKRIETTVKILLSNKSIPVEYVARKYTYNDIEPRKIKHDSIEFEPYKKFYIITNLRRIIDVSHFGKISVEDKIDVRHNGAKLKGPYEPTIQENFHTGRGFFYTYLPPSADNIRLFDEIGNISSSKVYIYDEYKTLKFQVRFPVINRWKSSYTIQYLVNGYEYLKSNYKKHYMLQMPAIGHILNGCVIENAEVEVILPEGANICDIKTPDGMERLQDRLKFTALTLYGRKTVVFTGKNLIEEQDLLFTVLYDFSLYYLLRVPVQLIIYVEFVFITIIIIKHCNFGFK